jgi:tRNA modification GTPase
LFNLLVKQNRSIVSDIAGTTRDYISEVIHIGGTNYKLVDTAGIRDSNDVIENIGIERAFEILNRAFFRILIINPFETNPEYIQKLSAIDFDILLISHWDKAHFFEKIAQLNLSKIRSKYLMAASFESGSIGPISRNCFAFGPIEPLNDWGFSGPIEPDLKSGSIGPECENIESGSIGPGSKGAPIEPLVGDLLSDKFKFFTQGDPILLDRHRISINKMHLKKRELSYKINDISDAAILSSEVNIFANYLSELIGIVSPDDVLNSIFSNFCIGK